MTDPTESEQAAPGAASDQAGECLEHLDKTNLATLAREQGMAALDVVGAFCDRLREIESRP